MTDTTNEPMESLNELIEGNGSERAEQLRLEAARVADAALIQEAQVGEVSVFLAQPWSDMIGVSPGIFSSISDLKIEVLRAIATGGREWESMPMTCWPCQPVAIGVPDLTFGNTRAGWDGKIIPIHGLHSLAETLTAAVRDLLQANGFVEQAALAVDYSTAIVIDWNAPLTGPVMDQTAEERN